MSLRVICVSAEAVDVAVAAIETDRRVAEAFLREPWPLLSDFLDRSGTTILLDFVQHTPGERSFAFRLSAVSDVDIAINVEFVISSALKSCITSSANCTFPTPAK